MMAAFFMQDPMKMLLKAVRSAHACSDNGQKWFLFSFHPADHFLCVRAPAY
jgi:hypothetical protein